MFDPILMPYADYVKRLRDAGLLTDREVAVVTDRITLAEIRGRLRAEDRSRLTVIGAGAS